ncbi:MAG: hypothetical protein HN521_04935 [Candidatus Latescibacteria bacterium]|jgi:peptidoglycan/xylan/chitin deacetylase (PgdA/CDA1 family)|nr:hypothetical protein [Candidatus Latescibacterota bacterium]MBT5829344.1 hypothetical protein [Candidatus Latescibacterota bacterium]
MPQTIILKADDIRYDPEHILPVRWQTFITYITEQNINAGLGLIGNSLEGAPSRYCKRLNQLHNNKHFEIWHHGYDHVLKGTNDKGDIYHEFFNTPFAHQLDHLQKTQALAKEKANIILRTFGAPGNGIDDTTTEALAQVPELKVWLYGKNESPLYNLKRTINLEYPVHNPDFASFQENYDSDQPCLVLQMHPNSWDDQRFGQFDQIIQLLKKHNAAFVLPYDSYLQQSA